MTKRALIFGNGNAAFFEDDVQIPKLQVSWILLLANFLKKHDVNPEEVEFTMPDGVAVEVFKTKNGYNWRRNGTMTQEMYIKTTN